jgi:hypothetical protein
LQASSTKTRSKFKMGIGLDVGTSFLIKAQEQEDGVKYIEFRDAFYRMKPATPIAGKMMEKGLKGLAYFKDTDGSFVVVGQDAIEKSIERNSTALRPLSRGVINPKEPEARRVLKFILTELVGKPEKDGETLVYSVPAEPVDQNEEEFNTGFHEDVLKKDLGALGWKPQPLNEAEAICYSELEDEDYTGICLSFGAGMVNICVMSSGEPVLRFSTTKSGDWIDRMAAQSTAQPDTVVQVEKENGKFKIGEESGNPILDAVSSYYIRLIDYTVRYLSDRLSGASDLPKFTDPVTVVVSGGTSRASGFVPAFRKRLEQGDFPLEVKKVRAASDPLRAVARGCMLAASM